MLLRDLGLPEDVATEMDTLMKSGTPSLSQPFTYTRAHTMHLLTHLLTQ